MPRMTKTKSNTMLLAALTAAMLVAGAAVAGPGQGPGQGPGPMMQGHGPGMGSGGMGDDPGPRLERVLERLDLSDDQWVAVRGIVDARRDAMMAKAQEMRDARQALGQAIHADTIDEAAIRQAAANVATVEADMAVERARSYQAIRAELTPEQQAELSQMIDRFRENAPHHARRHHRMR